MIKRLIHITITTLLAVSCLKPAPTTESVPITVTALSSPQTRGYVEGTTLSDTPYDKLHSASDKTHRTLVLTAWLYPQYGDDYEYFSDYVFQRQSDGVWHHDPIIYWPLGGTMDFMGYSSTQPFPVQNVTWGRGTSTDKLNLKFDKVYTQDDVLFACALNQNDRDEGPSVQMTFQHSQAWLEFILRTASSTEDNIITLYGITIKDIYTTGQLEIDHKFGSARGNWSFRFDGREDTLVDDNNGIYNTFMVHTNKYLDMLLPEQLMKNFIMEYTMEGSDHHMFYEFEMPTATWQMGKKYVYEIIFSPGEILVNPTVQNWDGNTTGINIQ